MTTKTAAAPVRPPADPSMNLTPEALLGMVQDLQAELRDLRQKTTHVEQSLLTAETGAKQAQDIRPTRLHIVEDRVYLLPLGTELPGKLAQKGGPLVMGPIGHLLQDRTGAPVHPERLTTNPMRFTVGQTVRLNPEASHDPDTRPRLPSFACPSCQHRFTGRLKKDECPYCGAAVQRVPTLTAQQRTWRVIFPACVEPDCTGTILDAPRLTRYGWKWKAYFSSLHGKKMNGDRFHDAELQPA